MTRTTLFPYFLFFLVFLTFGASINSRDLESYNLQHAGIEALVDHHSFAIGSSQVPRLKNPGDTFELEGKRFAAKQPGQFMLGALPYSALKLVGIGYSRNYFLSAALVSWLSTGFLVALASAALFLLCCRVWKYSELSGTCVALGYAFGTSVLAYAGVPHHDVLAGSIFIFALYFSERARLSAFDSDSKPEHLVCLSGLCFGLIPTFSMLAAPSALVFALGYFFRLPARGYFLLGLLLGLLPLAAYNGYYFGSPLIQANVAGGYSDTFLSPDFSRFLERINTFLGLGNISLLLYSPLALLGLLGVSFLGLPFAVLALVATLLHCGYIFNIQTIGHCQYGPRYLLPLLPFFMLGLAPLCERSLKQPGMLGRMLRLSLALVFTYSVGVNLIGALNGTMYCHLNTFAPVHFWNNLWAFKSTLFPLSHYCLPALAVFLLLTYPLLFALKAPSRSRLSEAPAVRPLLVFALLLIACGSYYFAHPNKFSAFDYTFRVAGELLEGSTGLSEQPPSWLNEFVPFGEHFYSVFPLGAVLCMLPFALLQDLALLQGLPSALINTLLAGISTLLAVGLCLHFRIPPRRQFWLVLFLLLGNWHWVNLSFGGSWQIALGIALTAQLGALLWALKGGSPIITGIWFALAFGNRTEVLLVTPCILYFSLQARGVLEPSKLRQGIVDILGFSLMPLILGLLTFYYNYARFGSPFDFGYARIPGVLDEPWYRQGIFSLQAIPHNIREMLFTPWKQIKAFPYLTPTGFGGSILLSAPLLFTLFAPGRRQLLIPCWIAISLLTFLLWTHGNPGGWQYSYRYAGVLLPWFFVLLLETSDTRSETLERVLVSFAVLINAYAVYLFNWGRYVSA